MSRAASFTNDPSLTGTTGLSALNRQPLSPEQQLQALKRVQAQAEQRVKLGMQLFKAAEARLSTQTDMLGQIKTLQSQLREQVNKDVAKSLHEYDQWIGQIDESFTTAIRKLEEKIDAVQANIVTSESRVKHMLDRAEALLDQNRCLVEQNSLNPTNPQPPQHTEPPTPPTPTATQAPSAYPIPPASTHKPITDNPTPSPISKLTPNPQTNPDTDLPNDSHQIHPDQEKIYSTLLQRLMKDDTEKDTADNVTEDEGPEGNASAA